MDDRKSVRWLGLLIFVPIIFAMFGGDRYRYPCQDPENWSLGECQKPQCLSDGTCPDQLVGKPKAMASVSPVTPTLPKPEVGVCK
jgi:hypothetical protein